MPRRTLLRALSVAVGLALVAGSGADAEGAPPPTEPPSVCTQPSTGAVPEGCWSALAGRTELSQRGSRGTDVAIARGNAYVDGLSDAVPGFTSNQLTFTPGNMASPAVLKAETGPGQVLGYDFSPDGSVLYGVDNGASSLIKVDQATGNRTTIGPMTKPASHNWIDVMIDPATGAAYAASANAASPDSYSLFSLDLATGATTLINTVATGSLPIDLAVNCSGEMYAETSIDDMLYRVDRATGALTAVGPLGVDLNFAQGMDFDNRTGVLHAWQVRSNTTSQYASINLATGASTPFPGGSQPGEFEGAIKNGCSDCAALRAAVAKAAKQLKKAKKRLKAARRGGHPQAIAKAKKKVKKAKRKLKAAKAELAAATVCR